MKRKVYLEGELGEKYGRELTMNVDCIADVLRCLSANFDDVEQYFTTAEDRDVYFAIEVGDHTLQNEQESLLEFRQGDIFITPVVLGSGGGFKTLLAGALLVFLAFQPWFAPMVGSYVGLATGWGTATISAIGAGVSYAVAGVGLALIAKGLGELLVPDPSTDEQEEGYLYQGTAQPVIEGDPVPVLYGKLRVPGRPVSFHVRNENQSFYNYGGVAETPFTTSGPINPNPGGGGGSDPSRDIDQNFVQLK